MFLCVVAEPGPVPQDPLPDVRLFQACQKTQHRGLASSVETQNDDFRSLVYGQVDGCEHLQRPVGL